MRYLLQRPLYTAVVFFLLFGLWACKGSQSSTGGTVSKPNTPPKPAPLVLTPNPYSSLVELDTRYGTLKIELFFDAGEHRANFIKLAKENFYDSLLFHRVIKGFMAQGGDPDSRDAAPGARLGTGGPGYELPAEIGQTYFHIKGALAAARTGDALNPERKSSGSQFYIVQGNTVSPSQLDKNERQFDMVYTQRQRELYTRLGGTPQLDMRYTVFGRVYEGLEIIDSLANEPTDPNNRPVNDLLMEVRVVRE